MQPDITHVTGGVEPGAATPGAGMGAVGAVLAHHDSGKRVGWEGPRSSLELSNGLLRKKRKWQVGRDLGEGKTGRWLAYSRAETQPALEKCPVHTASATGFWKVLGRRTTRMKQGPHTKGDEGWVNSQGSGMRDRTRHVARVRELRPKP